ncbi:methyltransferase domain-containing protein [Niabella terrae]
MPDIHYQQCPVCQSDMLDPVFFVKDYTVSGKVFEILHCRRCTARFTQDVPDQQEIGAYYKSEDYISHSNTSKDRISSLYQRVRRITLKQKASIVKQYTGKKAGQILDMGCGTGSFLHTMQRQGWQVTGLEPDADARQMALELYGLQTEPAHHLYQLPSAGFDAISLWHVLEHVHDLHATVSRLKALLRDQGRLFVAVPNYTSKDAGFYKEYWAGYDVPRHLYHFSPASMQQLMAQHGLKIIQRLPMWFDSFYVDMLSSKYKYGKISYISAGLHGLASNIHAIGQTEACCSVIYVIGRN